MKNITEFIKNELAMLNRGFIATPQCLQDLEAFTRANHGSSDFILMHMAIQYGMKTALEAVAKELEVEVGK